MDDIEQARAYAQADFEAPHSQFIQCFQSAFPDFEAAGSVIDMGCGPGDIAIRFARAFPKCVVHGIDGSAAMLRVGDALLAGAPELRGRVRLLQGLLPAASMPLARYDVVISNSLLHQLHDPQVLWSSVRRFAAPQAPVFIMDLRRPSSPDDAQSLRDRYVRGEPDILQRDFLNSLLAAFEPEEIVAQLETAGLSHFLVKPLGDRHVIVSGRM